MPIAKFEKARKTKLTHDLENFEQLANVAAIDVEQLKRGLQARIDDVTALLGRQTVQARQIYAADIEEAPGWEDRGRASRQRG